MIVARIGGIFAFSSFRAIGLSRRKRKMERTITMLTSLDHFRTARITTIVITIKAFFAWRSCRSDKVLCLSISLVYISALEKSQAIASLPVRICQNRDPTQCHGESVRASRFPDAGHRSGHAQMNCVRQGDCLDLSAFCSLHQHKPYPEQSDQMKQTLLHPELSGHRCSHSSRRMERYPWQMKYESLACRSESPLYIRRSCNPALQISRLSLELSLLSGRLPHNVRIRHT